MTVHPVPTPDDDDRRRTRAFLTLLLLVLVTLFLFQSMDGVQRAQEQAERNARQSCTEQWRRCVLQSILERQSYEDDSTLPVVTPTPPPADH